MEIIRKTVTMLGNDYGVLFFPKPMIPSRGLIWPKYEIKYNISSLLTSWSYICTLDYLVALLKKWKLICILCLPHHQALYSPKYPIFYICPTLSNIEHVLFSSYNLFSDLSACFSFQGCVFEHISPNVKPISDNKYQKLWHFILYNPTHESK